MEHASTCSQLHHMGGGKWLKDASNERGTSEITSRSGVHVLMRGCQISVWACGPVFRPSSKDLAHASSTSVETTLRFSHEHCHDAHTKMCLGPWVEYLNLVLQLFLLLLQLHSRHVCAAAGMYVRLQACMRGCNGACTKKQR